MAKSKDGQPSQRALVKEALDTLGGDALPQAIIDHIKSKYGVELKKPNVSAYKSGLKAGGRKGKPGRKPGRPRKNPLAAVSAPVTVRASSMGGSVSIEDLTTVKGLLDRVGSKGLEKLVGLLS